MILKRMKEKKWFNGAVIACIGVAFYVLLTNFPVIWSCIRYFLRCFRPVFIGFIMAYIINPLAEFFYYRIFKRMKVGKARWILSALLAFVLVMTAFNLLIIALIPQLVQSVIMFTDHMDEYTGALRTMLKDTPLDAMIGEWLESGSSDVLASISQFASKNATGIMNMAAGYGKNILSFAISTILAIYMLFDKKRLLTGIWRLVRTLFRNETTELIMDFTLRCDTILVRYVGQSILDAMIVGCTCAVFMAVFGMQYLGLISAVVGITNLIPNFGPVIGGVIGGFILLLVSPRHALMFGIFILLLQLVDGYILKPKLFSGSLGVSGLLILIHTIVLGNLLGILGVLLSIPFAAVMNFIYNDYFMPWLEKRKQVSQGDGSH